MAHFNLSLMNPNFDPLTVGLDKLYYHNFEVFKKIEEE